MIEKTGPTIYKGESVYKTGAGGGGPYPRLYYRVEAATDTRSGWRFGNDVAQTGAVGLFSINTGMATYALCPHINNAKKIYVKYKINFTQGPGSRQYRILDTDFEIGYRLFTSYIYADSQISFYLKNGSTNVYDWERYMTLTQNMDYKFEHLLDVENSKFICTVNNIKRIEQTIDLSLLNLDRYIPAFGTEANYPSYSYLPPGFKFYRNEFSYKLDGVEQLTMETLE